MKTRRCDREAVALWAAGALDPVRAEALRLHVAGCPKCRRYHAEMVALCVDLGAGERALPEYDLAPRVPAEVRRRVAGAPSRGTGALPERSWRRRTWGFAGAVAAIALVLAWIAWDGLGVPRRPVSMNTSVPQASAAGAATSRSSSRYGTYRDALNRSDADFERLFTPEAPGTGDAPVVYRPGRARFEAEL